MAFKPKFCIFCVVFSHDISFKKEKFDKKKKKAQLSLINAFT